MGNDTSLAASTEAISFVISSSFRASPRLASSISRLVADFCKARLGDMEVTSRFHMATHELAENITKYSTNSRVSLEVELSEGQGSHTLSVKTRNQTSPDRLAEVARRLEELKCTKDPMALYDRIIEQSAPIDGVSGLGLARVRAEGGFEFDYAIEGNELTLVARAAVPKAAPDVP